jgi:Type IV secretory pathway, VirB11 components, and related ATPases involved in archaeal flagella biosynthesis
MFDLATQLCRAVESIRADDSTFNLYDPAVMTPLISYDPPSQHTEYEQYWVNAPYSSVAILDPRAGNQLLYQVVVPELSGFETDLLASLKRDIRDRFIYADTDADTPADSVEVLTEIMTTILNQYGVQIDDESFHKLLYYTYRDFSGYGRLSPMMNDPHVEDISCVGDSRRLFVYHDEYADIPTSVAFEQQQLDAVVARLAQRSGEELSVSNPLTNATLPDGSRAELVYSDEVSPHGSAFTIRKYSAETITPADLIVSGTFSPEQLAYLWLAIEQNMNLLFVGGTASGKTTSLNAVSMFLPPGSKVVTIEDTPELSLCHNNWLPSVTRERSNDGNSIDMYRLLRSALRHRPEYIIVGEIRGTEAATLFQAMNTGHTTYSTMHADSLQTVINRLENEPINVPRPMIGSLDIVSVQRLARIDDERVRRTGEIVEIHDIDQRTGDLNYSTLYNWRAAEDTFAGSAARSAVLDRIAERRGWSDHRLTQAVRRRQRVLEHLVAREITAYDQFTSVIDHYTTNPAAVLEWVADDTESAGPSSPE